MSKETPDYNAGSVSRKDFLQNLKDHSLFIAWIAGLVIIGALVWSLSRPLLTSYMLRSVNQSLASGGTGISLSGAKTVPPIKHSPVGIWYSIDNSSDLFFIFTIFQDGIMNVCGARLSPGNIVTEIIPVSAHSQQVFNRISPGIISMYMRRIESAAAQWGKNE